MHRQLEHVYSTQNRFNQFLLLFIHTRMRTDQAQLIYADEIRHSSKYSMQHLLHARLHTHSRLITIKTIYPHNCRVTTCCAISFNGRYLHRQLGARSPNAWLFGKRYWNLILIFWNSPEITRLCDVNWNTTSTIFWNFQNSFAVVVGCQVAAQQIPLIYAELNLG